jgi:hypothetical protein
LTEQALAREIIAGSQALEKREAAYQRKQLAERESRVNLIAAPGQL